MVKTNMTEEFVSKAVKKPIDAKLLRASVLDVTNDRIIAEWLVLPSFVLECPIFTCCSACRRCWDDNDKRH